MNTTAILLISCPDRKGIVAAVSDFLYRKNANILHADEHQDSEQGLFLMRIEWDLKDFSLSKSDFVSSFSQLSKEFNMEWEVKYSQDLISTALLVSRETHCLADLLYRYKSGELPCSLKVIISNHTEGKDLSDSYGIPFFHVPVVDNNNKKDSEKEIQSLLKKYNVDLIVLARYMQILSEDFISAYAQRIINIHHSFLPAFIGAKPYHQAYGRGVKLIGATSHYVTEQLDTGPIIEQDVVRVTHRDTVSDFIRKGKDLERVVLSRAVLWYLTHKILVYDNKTVVFV